MDSVVPRRGPDPNALPRAIGAYDVKDASAAARSVPQGETLTLQQFADDADINSLVRRFGITGEIPVVSRQPAEYGDFSVVNDFQTAMEQLKRGQAAFDALPAKVRDEFDNDPARFWEFVQDPKSVDKAVELGLLKKVDSVASVAPEAASAVGTGDNPPPA